jgi:hypothetical protein
VSKPFGATKGTETEESTRRRIVEESFRQKIVITARKMLDGELSFIEGARVLIEFRFIGNTETTDPDMLAFVVIDSETDALPFGDVRAHWQPEALVRLQPEIESAEQWAREVGSDSCRNLIRRFS